MRTRSREINIFSLSLMDVISGAMGAFLIIMVILARYYVFDPNVKQNTDDLRIRLDAAISGLNRIRGGTEQIFSELIESDTGATTTGLATGDALAQIEALSQGITQDIARVNNQLGVAQAQINDLEEELQEKSAQIKRAEERIAELEQRNPLVVQAMAACPQDVELFIESDRVGSASGEQGVPFDPRYDRVQGFTGDNGLTFTGGPSAEIRMVGKAIRGTSYKLFVHLQYPPLPDAGCEVWLHVLGWGDFWARAGETTLTPDRPFDFMGTVRVDDDMKFSYSEPTAEEREAELAVVRERMATTPGPVEEKPDETRDGEGKAGQ